VIAAAALTAFAAASGTGALAGRAVAYHRISMGEYQNFLTNWDERKQPVLYALADTPAHYAALFHPAPVNFGNRHFAPEPALYATDEILVAGRVMPNPPDGSKVFDVESLTEDGHDLTLRYRFHDSGSKASFTVKDYLALRIPKHSYRKIVFIENGKRIGELAPAEGVWSVPAIAPDAAPSAERKNR
jgi:hypothetical protein